MWIEHLMLVQNNWFVFLLLKMQSREFKGSVHCQCFHVILRFNYCKILTVQKVVIKRNKLQDLKYRIPGTWRNTRFASQQQEWTFYLNTIKWGLKLLCCWVHQDCPCRLFFELNVVFWETSDIQVKASKFQLSSSN